MLFICLLYLLMKCYFENKEKEIMILTSIYLITHISCVLSMVIGYLHVV